MFQTGCFGIVIQRSVLARGDYQRAAEGRLIENQF